MGRVPPGASLIWPAGSTVGRRLGEHHTWRRTAQPDRPQDDPQEAVRRAWGGSRAARRGRMRWESHRPTGAWGGGSWLRMKLSEALLLLAAGTLGGILSTAVSIASLVTYPALLALGVPP